MKGARTPPLEARYYDLPKRVASMNRQGVAVQALSLTAPMVYWAQGELGRRLAREWNDGASAAHTAYPDRFVVCATLPMQDTTLALAELDRAARLPGVRAVYMGTNIEGRNLSDPAFFPVFERCQALGLPVGLHPFNVNGAERLRALLPDQPARQPVRHRHRGGAPHLRRGAGPAAEAAGDPAARGRHVPAGVGAAAARAEGAAGGEQGGEEAGARLPAPLHLRHHQPRSRARCGISSTRWARTG